MFSLKGKTMIISGASGDRPDPTVNMALACGANVCFLSGNHERVIQAMKYIDPKYRDHIIGFAQNPQFKLELNRKLAPNIYKEDSTSHDVLRWIYERFGSIDIMVHASGGGFARYTMENTDKDYWHRTAAISENLFFNTMYALPYLEKSKSPVVINVVSDEGYHGGYWNNPACASARGSVLTLTKEMARELAPKGIRVNCVMHSYIDGDGPDATAIWLTDEEKEKLISATPLKRMCTREDIAGIINFLASDEASFITGAVVPVNGGLTL